MAKFRLRDRLRYRFDATLSRGATGLIVWLFVLAGFIALISATIVTLSHTAPPGPGGVRPGFSLLVWQAWQRTLNLTVGYGPLPYIIGTFIPTLGSLFIGGIFIGLLTGGIQNKIRNLRKGRSLVIEQGHTVILGWSQQIFQVISEIAQANANKEDACIVVLGEKDKVEMEDTIREKVKKLGRTRIVCRTGNPLDLTDLAIVNPDAARSVIVLAPDNKDPDAHVIKAMLALTRRQGGTGCPIVAEIRSPRNRPVAQMLGKARVRVVLVDELIARITVQTCRQVGLSAVYGDLLSFEGDELYLKHEPALTGKTFGEALMAYETSCAVGLQRDGQSRFNPPLATVIKDTDKLIALSRDDDTIFLSGRTDIPIDTAAICDPPVETRTPERTLLIGWNRRAPLIIKELDQYVVPGSILTVAADLADGANIIEKQGQKVKNLAITFRGGDTSDRTFLEALEVATYDHVITLGYSDKLGPQESDALTIITLLHLRDMADKLTVRFSIVSEMLDARNRELAEVARADDFIVGDKIVSQLLAQMSENPELIPDDLFDAGGSELYLKPASHYVSLDKPVNFYTIVESARRHHEVAIGYRLVTKEAQLNRASGMHLNPNKAEPIKLSAQDQIIILSES
jgi:voltage-gated potassium channel Kch